ncbi:MAG: Hsp20/alpha crystallin family protein [Gemmatimonadota bacterium]
MLVTTTRRAQDLPSAFANLQRLSQVLDNAFGLWPFSREETGALMAWVPPVDVFEDKERIKIVAELPGVGPDDVKLSLENNTLTIRGEKKQVAEESTERVHRYERTYGAFERSFTLPTTVDAEKIQASYENGVLTVILPKAERARPREIAINVARK